MGKQESIEVKDKLDVIRTTHLGSLCEGSVQLGRASHNHDDEKSEAEHDKELKNKAG